MLFAKDPHRPPLPKTFFSQKSTKITTKITTKMLQCAKNLL